MQEFLTSVRELVTLQAAPAVYLVHGAMIAYALGMVCRNQLPLRLHLMAGTVLYIAYYYFYPATPLWDAIFASTVIGLANIVGLYRLTMERLPLFMGENGAVLEAFDAIAPDTIQPGEVRRLMRGNRVETVTQSRIATREGAVPNQLILLMAGRAGISKHGSADTHPIVGPCFIAEIAFITSNPASADVVLGAGSTIVTFQREALAKKMAASAGIDRALRSLISYDLAGKLSRSVPRVLDDRARAA